MLNHVLLCLMGKMTYIVCVHGNIKKPQLPGLQTALGPVHSTRFSHYQASLAVGVARSVGVTYHARATRMAGLNFKSGSCYNVHVHSVYTQNLHIVILTVYCVYILHYLEEFVSVFIFTVEFPKTFKNGPYTSICTHTQRKPFPFSSPFQ